MTQLAGSWQVQHPRGRTDEGVGVRAQPQAGDKVGNLLFRPLGYEAGGAAFAVARVGECGGRVLGAHMPGRGGRALGVVDRYGRALDDAALVLVAGLVVLVRVVVVVARVGHGGDAGEQRAVGARTGRDGGAKASQSTLGRCGRRAGRAGELGMARGMCRWVEGPALRRALAVDGCIHGPAETKRD